MKKYSTFLIVLFVMFVSSALFAQSGVGKLSGTVVDEITREPLIGANVILVNTDLGAATDVEGKFFILNIAPGTYEVRISYVGYAPRLVQDVRVVAGITYNLNVELTTDFTLPEIVVQDKKFFEEKATNTTKVFDSEEIGRLPIKGVEKLASLQAGVVISEGSGGAGGNAVINVRGGRGGEVLYIVDGVPQNEIYSGTNNSQVSNSAIEQLSFQIGGYEAKYGQAQSGIVNVTTKSGNPTYSVFGDVLTSSFTDDFGYNLYTLNFSGPIIPGSSQHTFFLSGERGWNKDNDPRAVGVSFNSDVVYDSPYKENMDEGIYRYTARTNHSFGPFQLRLGANVNFRDFRGYINTYAKNNSEHNILTKRENWSFSSRLSQSISSNAFWNINFGYRIFKDASGDGIWFDNLEAYGDSIKNDAIGVTLPFQGARITMDDVGIFHRSGRTYNIYNKTDIRTFTVDANFTAQIENHLFEVGGGFNYNTVRFFSIYDMYRLAGDNLQDLPELIRYSRLQPTSFGYDLTGRNEVNGDEFTDYNGESIQTGFAPKSPILAYGYIQDRFELSDIVLNLGLRFDYFDSKTEVIKDPFLPYAAGDPNAYDAADFTTKNSELYFSPRIGLGFPITSSTVFHAQYGKFIQQPQLNQLYSTTYDLNFLITDQNWNLNTGHVESEITTQYEIGFRQVLGDVAALNLTAFYKNTQGLINTATVFYQRQEGGQTLRYITPTNTDFGTIKGLALSLDVSRISYFSMSVNYTYSIAEGTGSSTSSSFVAAFRNNTGEIPKVIAPLDFDQRHTGTINLDFFVPKGDLGFLEMTGANVIVSFASGRPYTPLETQNLIAGSINYGDTRGYVNSATAPGNFRIDLKLEKSFAVGKLLLTPYLWIENLLDAANPVAVYNSTGDPYSTAWLSTEEAKDIVASKTTDTNPNGGKYFAEDYKSLERSPYNFGIPRLIKLGFKVNFSNFTF
ncbi:MAG: TonB-dependent receptor [Ignavibacteriaceae bacterium]|nr:TonB-dependent receptor [Ignavibacteriaceae bacterium]